MAYRARLIALAALLCAASGLLSQEKPSALPEEFARLETVWNEAHLQGDVKALEGLWADDLSIVVPKMPLMGKGDVLEMWRRVPVRITRYESSELAARRYGETAVVTGRIVRVRDFGGRRAEENWLFTKVYLLAGGGWKVVAFHVSEAPE